MDPNVSGVIITLKDVYTSLTALTAKVDTLLGEHTAETKSLTDHESRLRSLERGRWPMTSLTVLIALATLALGVIVAIGGMT